MKDLFLFPEAASTLLPFLMPWFPALFSTTGALDALDTDIDSSELLPCAHFGVCFSILLSDLYLLLQLVHAQD